jgi:hypothetical protein
MINLSAALTQPTSKGERELEEAMDQAARQGVIMVVAAGNQGTLGSSAITRYPWVNPAVACDLRGRPIGESNLGSSIGRRGLAAPVTPARPSRPAPLPRALIAVRPDTILLSA